MGIQCKSSIGTLLQIPLKMRESILTAGAPHIGAHEHTNLHKGDCKHSRSGLEPRRERPPIREGAPKETSA